MVHPTAAFVCDELYPRPRANSHVLDRGPLPPTMLSHQSSSRLLALSGVVKSCPELSRCSRVFQRFPGQFLKRSGAIHDVIRKRPNASFQSPRCSSGFLKSHSSAVSISRVASCIRRRRSSMAIAASSASGGTCSARVTSEKLGRSARSKVRDEELIEGFRSGIKRSGTGIGAGSGVTLGLEFVF